MKKASDKWHSVPNEESSESSHQKLELPSPKVVKIFNPYQCLCQQRILQAAHNISDLLVRADTMLCTRAKVCQGSHDLDLVC